MAAMLPAFQQELAGMEKSLDDTKRAAAVSVTAEMSSLRTKLYC